jgi:hypothetical protein
MYIRNYLISFFANLQNYLNKINLILGTAGKHGSGPSKPGEDPLSRA